MAEHEALDSQEYRLATLASNKIFLADTPMDQWAWFQLSLAMGINELPADYTKQPFEKFVKRIRDTSTLEELKGTVAKTLFLDPGMNSMVVRMEEKKFTEAAVWNTVRIKEVMPGWKTRLPISKPTFVYGYRDSAFAPSALVVQWSMMPQIRTDQLDLTDIFQPVRGLFWPFLIVEVVGSDSPRSSMSAAKHAAAGSAASCTTAARLIISALEEYGKDELAGVPAKKCYDAAQVFSVSVAVGKAALSMHTCNSSGQHTMTEIRSFDLRRADEIGQLRAQVDGILSWATKSRLPLIQRLLNWFGRTLQAKTALGIKFPRLSEKRGSD
ncbi:MAG: hypothetical protein Q9160_007012 [Pyrenula sp. 1 TL-2023]